MHELSDLQTDWKCHLFTAGLPIHIELRLRSNSPAPDNVFAKFVIERQDTDKMQTFSLAA